MPLADSWPSILDDLEARVRAAEAGNLGALEGWHAPDAAPPMTASDQHRANGIVARQHALLARLRDERTAVAASLRALRRPAYKPAPTAAPVYLDRLG